MQIGNRKIGPGEPCFIIAEAGVNHNGELDLALQLVEEGAKAGADCVKFQTFSTEYSESQYSLKPSYFDGRDEGMSKLDFSRSLELNKEEFQTIKNKCEECGITFLSMAADLPSLEILVDIGSDAVKLSSSDTLNFPLFKAIGETGLPTIYSTGISTLDDVKKGFEYLRSCGVNDLSILQCTSQYPAPFPEINLRVMQTYQDTFGVPSGLSDHSHGLHIPYAAVAMGASIIEKHFTLDRRLPGVDHIASIEPSELAEMVARIREIEQAMGDGVKRVSNSEAEHLQSMRKSIFSLTEIKKGEVLSLQNIGSKRPGDGISPTEIDNILGRSAARDLPKDERLQWQDIDGN